MSKDIPPNPRALALRREKRQIVFSSDLWKNVMFIDCLDRTFFVVKTLRITKSDSRWESSHRPYRGS